MSSIIRSSLIIPTVSSSASFMAIKGNSLVQVVDIGEDNYYGSLFLRKTPRLVRELVQVPNDVKTVEGFSVDHENPFEVDYGNQIVTHVFSCRNLFGSLSSRGKYRGFHGSSLQGLKAHGIEQIFDKEFNLIGQRIYFAAAGTAIEYALKQNLHDCGGSGWGNTQLERSGTLVKAEDGTDCMLVQQAVILAISSDEPPTLNNPISEPHLHKHHYFSGKNPVYIDGMWLVHHNTMNVSAVNEGMGVGNSQRMIALAQRATSNVVKFY